MKGDYEEFHALGRRKNKANSEPIAGLWPEIRNELNWCCLKKQSQFVSVQCSAFSGQGRCFVNPVKTGIQTY